MASIKPFRGLRPAAELAAAVASPPYDVMDCAEAAQLIAANKLSFLQVTRTDAVMPGADPHSPEVYAAARAKLDWFVAEGILRRDPKPCFYIYEQRLGGHTQLGLVMAASLEEYEAGLIKKHELTRPEKELDRVNHILATGAQTGPVFLAYRDDAQTAGVLAGLAAKEPVCRFTASDGVEHSLRVVDDAADIAALEQAFARVPALYIADGHHRAAAAARVAGEAGGAAGRFLAVAFPHSQLRIMDYNRVVRDLAGLSPAEFLAAVAGKFEVSPAADGPVKPAKPRTFGMYLQGKWYELAAKPAELSGRHGVAALDVSVLQDMLLAPLLRIGDPRTDKRIDFVGGIRGLGELERLVDGGGFAVAFSLFPTSLEELMATADAGKTMPPKSTWFEPKLRDAMVVKLVAE